MLGGTTAAVIVLFLWLYFFVVHFVLGKSIWKQREQMLEILFIDQLFLFFINIVKSVIYYITGLSSFTRKALKR